MEIKNPVMIGSWRFTEYPCILPVSLSLDEVYLVNRLAKVFLFLFYFSLYDTIPEDLNRKEKTSTKTIFQNFQMQRFLSRTRKI
ncbi:MAG: hypothetical protein L6Q54_05610 [Leptospiraceae bacterium]|nr:hypothetical protein [Leptospiraceae bacterium]MCK6380715.1 hypothetical protein [Leptospiraceae bacterium]NUM41241.1 hypothetical protein [Leptospiraceae bacterium]